MPTNQVNDLVDIKNPNQITAGRGVIRQSITPVKGFLHFF